MDNKKFVGGSSSSSSSDHLFGPNNSSSGVLGSIFPPPPTAHGRDSGFMGSHYQGGNGKYGPPPAGNTTEKRGENREAASTRSSNYHTETSEPCNFSSSISYGGQENYSNIKKDREIFPVEERWRRGRSKCFKRKLVAGFSLLLENSRSCKLSI